MNTLTIFPSDAFKKSKFKKVNRGSFVTLICLKSV
jgi:hypothetical protein